MNTVTQARGSTTEATATSKRWGMGLWKGLSSHAVAQVLMALLLVSLAAQAVLPQEGRIPPLQYAQWRASYPLLAGFVEALGLQRVAYTPWFWGVCVILAVSLALSTARRAVRLWRHGPAPRGPMLERSIVGEQTDISHVATRLRRLGYTVTSPEGSLVAQRGAAGPWGSVLFHAGMLVLVTGAFLSAGTRFNGYVELAPGQLFLPPGDSFAQTFSGFLVRGTPEVAVNVEDIGIAFWPDGTVRDIHVQATARNSAGHESRGFVQRNQTLGLDDVAVTLGSPHGAAVLLEYDHPARDGAPASGYVHFTEEAGRLLNRFTVPGTETLITAEIVGDWRGALEGAPDARAVSLVLRTAAADAGHGATEVERGGSVPLGDGELTFLAIRPWVLLMISQDRGLPVMTAGGAMALVGLAFALLVPMRWVTVRRRPEGFLIQARSSWAAASVRRDMDRLVQAMQGPHD